MLDQEELRKIVSDKVKTAVGDQLIMILTLQTELEQANQIIGELRVELATLKHIGDNDAVQTDPARVLSGPSSDRVLPISRPAS